MIPPIILIVDDDPAQLVLYSLTLRHLPYSIMTARNAEEALQTIYATPPALIVLDVMLPGVNGLALLRALRADEDTLSIKVILLTVMGDLLSSAETALANAVLTKPVQRNELEQEITRLLQ